MNDRRRFFLKQFITLILLVIYSIIIVAHNPKNYDDETDHLFKKAGFAVIIFCEVSLLLIQLATVVLAFTLLTQVRRLSRAQP